MSWWTSIWRTRASEWCHGWIGDTDSQEILPDEYYVTITLQSIHLPYVRKGLTRFFGAVHCFSKLAHNAQGDAEFHAFTVPSGLKGIDAAGLHNVVSTRKTLLGPVPYRGGVVALEIALFSIASQDLAEPFLSLLEGVSDTIGVAYIGVATNLLRQLSNGVESISKSSDGSTLEIGLSTDLGPVMTGSYIVIREQRKLESLVIDQSGRLLDKSQGAIGAPYFIFEVVASRKRDDWRRIPSLLEAYRRLEEPVLAGRVPDVQGLLTAFRRIVLLSPDLLHSDATRIVSEVEKRINAVMAATFTSRTQRTLPALDDISI